MEDANDIIDYGDPLARSSFFEHIGRIAAVVLVAPIAADRTRLALTP